MVLTMPPSPSRPRDAIAAMAPARGIVIWRMVRRGIASSRASSTAILLTLATVHASRTTSAGVGSPCGSRTLFSPRSSAPKYSEHWGMSKSVPPVGGTFHFHFDAQSLSPSKA